MSAPATEYVYVCTAANVQVDGTCSVPVWVEKLPPLLPPLSFEEGVAVAFAIAGIWAIGLGLRVMWRAARV